MESLITLSIDVCRSVRRRSGPRSACAAAARAITSAPRRLKYVAAMCSVQHNISPGGEPSAADE